MCLYWKNSLEDEMTRILSEMLPTIKKRHEQYGQSADIL